MSLHQLSKKIESFNYYIFCLSCPTNEAGTSTQLATKKYCLVQGRSNFQHYLDELIGGAHKIVSAIGFLFFDSLPIGNLREY